MTRRQFTAAFLVPAATQRWNILWIRSEDTSPDLGSYGDP